MYCCGACGQDNIQLFEVANANSGASTTVVCTLCGAEQLDMDMEGIVGYYVNEINSIARKPQRKGKSTYSRTVHITERISAHLRYFYLSEKCQSVITVVV